MMDGAQTISVYQIEVTSIIAITITTLGFFINFLAYRRSVKRESIAAANTSYQLLSEVRATKGLVEDMRSQFNDHAAILREHGKDIAVHDAKIANIEKRLNDNR
jgi:hypothetical protein